MANNRVISKLSVILGVNSAELVTGLQTGAATVRKFDRQVSGAAGSLKSFDANQGVVSGGLAKLGGSLKTAITQLALFAAASVAAGVTVRGFTDSFSTLDKLAKTAAKLGESVGALQAFGFAAKLTGVGADTANTALQRLTRRVSAAAGGSGEAVNALKELGLSAEALNKLTPTQKFSELAQAFGAIEDPAARVRLAFALFDTEGVALVNTLALGKAGLQAVYDEFERLGGSVGGTGTAAIEEANDAITSLQTAGSLLAQKFAVAIAPSVEMAADAFTELAIEIGPDLVEIFKDLRPGIEAAVTAFTQLVKVFVEVAKYAAEGARRLEGLGLNARGLQFIASPIAGFAEMVGFITPAARGAANSLDEVRAAAAEIAKQDLLDFTAAAESANAMKEAMEGAKKEAEEWSRIGERLTDSMKTPFEKAQDEIGQASEALRRGVISWQTYERAVNQALDSVEQKQSSFSLTANSGTAAAIRGTSSGFQAAQQSFDAARQLQEAVKASAERDAARNKLLEDVRRKLAEVNQSIRNGSITVREGRI